MLLVSYPFRIFALIDMLRCGLYQIVLPLANMSYVFLCLPMLSRSLPPTSGKPVSWILALTAIVISRAKGSTFHSGPVGIRSSWVLSIWDIWETGKRDDTGFATGSVLQLLNTSPDWNNQEMNHVQGWYGDLWLKLSEFNIYQVGGRYASRNIDPSRLMTKRSLSWLYCAGFFIPYGSWANAVTWRGRFLGVHVTAIVWVSYFWI